MKNVNKRNMGILILSTLLSTTSMSNNNPITPGVNLGTDDSTSIGKGSITTGSGTQAIGNNNFASGNNMTKAEYDKFIKENNERLKIIQQKMQKVGNDKKELDDLKAKHQDIVNKINRIKNYESAIEEKTQNLANTEPTLLAEIEVKKGEQVSFQKQIEDLEKRINIINQLDFSLINENNKGESIKILAQDLKTKMEEGQTWLKEHGDNGIPIEEYENVLKNFISKQRNNNITSKLTNEYDISTDNITSWSNEIYIKPRHVYDYDYNIIQEIRYQMDCNSITSLYNATPFSIAKYNFDTVYWFGSDMKY